ncbi:MAG: polysaccharide biosynthesis/export family protein [Pseudobacteriovorax sp.]|nr:polysaccharide biosynthesis/export family protein [Pseudobacteriovorax sp.]
MRFFSIFAFISIFILGCKTTPEEKPVVLPDISRAPVGTTFSANSGDYIFAPDDVIEVYVHRQPKYSGRFLVKQSGHIILPGIGPVFAKNRSVGLLKTAIQIKLKPHVKYPRVTVAAASSHSYKVTFSGNIRSPGVYTFSEKTTLLEGLARAGGAVGDSARVILIRSDKTGLRQRYTTSLEEMAEKKSIIDNFVLERGDIIFIN